jgi:hypothetical protein
MIPLLVSTCTETSIQQGFAVHREAISESNRWEEQPFSVVQLRERDGQEGGQPLRKTRFVWGLPPSSTYRRP